MTPRYFSSLLIPDSFQLLDHIERYLGGILLRVELHLIEPKSLFYLVFARLYKELLFGSVLSRIQLVVREYVLPLDVTEGLEDHERDRVGEALLHHGQHHAVSVVLVFFEVLVQLLNYIVAFHHQLLALLLTLGQEVCAEDDFGVVDSKHLELILCLVDGVLDLDLEDADVVFATRKLFFLIHQHFPAHLYLRDARSETCHFRIVLGRSRQVASPCDFEVRRKQYPICHPAQQVRC